MDLKKRGVLLFFLMIFSWLFFFSCTHHQDKKNTERAFYYWKSVVKLTGFEKLRLDSLKITSIYLKFFDVSWDAASNTPLPVAKVQLPDTTLLLKYHIIPTVFISNACLQRIDSVQTLAMAGQVYQLIKAIAATGGIIAINEIQIDCDWTATTASKYFLLLHAIKKLSKVSLSVTIRLHQVKYVGSSGLPPADRGLLMCYNMGNLRNPASNNSIIETSELKKYTGNLASYPLPLDVALPLFEWMVLFRNNTYTGLVENLAADTFTPAFAQINGNRIAILKDTVLSGYGLKKGDILRREESKITEVLAAATTINKRLKNLNLRVSLYHLDSLTLSKYTTDEIESIYNCFR